MCVISYIGDQYNNDFPNRWPKYDPSELLKGIYPDVTRAEFEALRSEVQELKKLLLAAKEFDEKTGQPNCEIDEKVALIKAIAKAVGVDMSQVFDK